jgi:phosphodiesterase/alkaline phosphatase D-like protein
MLFAHCFVSQNSAGFYETLAQSKARDAIWRVIGQQIVFTQIDYGGFCESEHLLRQFVTHASPPVDLDAWDGYRANRHRVLDYISKHKINNAIVLSGDSHANWVSDVAFPNDTTQCVDRTIRSDREGAERPAATTHTPARAHTESSLQALL